MALCLTDSLLCNTSDNNNSKLELNGIDFKKRLWLWWENGYNNNLKGKVSFGIRSSLL